MDSNLDKKPQTKTPTDLTKTKTPKTTTQVERRKDPLRHWKGLIITQLKFYTEGMSHMALLIRIGTKKHQDSQDLEKSLRELTFKGVITCSASRGSMLYKFKRETDSK